MKNPFRFQEVWVNAVISDGEIDGIVNKGILSSTERFEIYKDAFWLRLDGVLTTIFPKFKNKIGEENWNELVLEGIQEHPPHSWTAVEVGECFLKHVEHVGHEHLQVAQREWAQEKAIALGEDFPSFATEAAQLSEQDWVRATLILHPSIQRVGEWVTWSTGDGKALELELSTGEMGIFSMIQERLPLGKWGEVSTSPLLAKVLEQWAQSGLISGIKWR